MPLQFDLYKAGIVNGYKTLYAGEAIATSQDAEDLHDPLPAPQAVILDVSRILYAYKLMYVL